MKEKITITIEDLDNMPSVLRSLELLFQKLIYYYSDKDVGELNILILSISSYFGQLLKWLGYNEDDFRSEE
jgi:hypothetical protein